MTAGKELERMKKFLSPEQQQIAETLATLRVERDMLQRQVAVLQKSYDELFKLFVLLLSEWPDQELRIHPSQFLRFKEEYRIDRSIDPETREIVFKLLYITD